MKASVSIPDELFEEADRLARSSKRRKAAQIPPTIA